MRKLFFAAVLLISMASRAVADEGMWLPLLLGKQVYDDMVKKGLKLTKEQLYQINKPSLKDAIIIFGGGCTGEIVSSKGLIFTNHHCGYDAIASASSVEKNYLRDGFYAKTTAEEIQTSLSVQFLLRIDDVTKEVMDSLQGLTGTERLQKQAAVLAVINKRLSNAAESIETRVSSLFKGNQFLAFVYQRYSDIRLVGTPPESVGKFGGDTDNWEWPRHTGDFSVFRVYTDAVGKPAKYNAANIPFKPKWYLPVSLKPLKDGDFAKLQLASSYASIANYWKFFDGETKQLLKYDVVGQKKKDEEKFNQWAKGKPAYENLFTDWGKAYDAWRPYAKHQMFMREGILGSPLVSFASSLIQVEAALTRPGTAAADVRKAIEAADQGRKAFLESENKVSDQKILGAVTKMYFQEIDKQQHPATFFPTLKNQYGSLEDDETYRRYAADVFTKTLIFDDARWAAFVAKPDAATLQADPAFAYASTFITNYNSKYGIFSQQFNAKNAEFGRIYLKGVIEMDTVKAKKMYPDATFTMRVRVN